MGAEREITDKTIYLLAEHSDSERAKLSEWYHPTDIEVYGLKSATLKKVISEVKREVTKKLVSGRKNG